MGCRQSQAVNDAKTKGQVEKIGVDTLVKIETGQKAGKIREGNAQLQPSHQQRTTIGRRHSWHARVLGTSLAPLANI